MERADNYSYQNRRKTKEMNNILFKLKKARQADDLQAVKRYEYEYFGYRYYNIKVGDRVILRQIDNPTHTEEDEVVEVNCNPEIYPNINSLPSPVKLKNNESDWSNFFRIIKFVEE